MAMRPPVGAPTLNRRTRILLIAAGVLVLLLLGGSRLITFYVDWLWFGEVGYRGVFTTILFTRLLQFLLGAVLIGGAVALSLWIAYRFRPVFVRVYFALPPPATTYCWIVDATLGNPLFALELGRSLGAEGLPAIGEDCPCPTPSNTCSADAWCAFPAGHAGCCWPSLSAATCGKVRCRRSPTSTLSTTPSMRACSSSTAVECGPRTRCWQPPRPSTPTHASGGSSTLRSRTWSRTTSFVPGTLRSPQELPDEPLAELVTAAAAGAAVRGAVREAALLGEHALRLTPAGSAERSERVLALAHYFGVAGEKQRVTDLLTAELEELPPGSRTRACLPAPAGGVVRSNDEIRGFLERALAESEGLPEARAAALANMATQRGRDPGGAGPGCRGVGCGGAGGGAWRRAGDRADRPLFPGLGRSLRGRPIEDLRARFGVVSDAVSYLLGSPDRVAGQQFVWRGRLDEARALLWPMLSTADERGESVSYALARLHVCELELRAGSWAEAARLLDEWADPSERGLLTWPMYERCRSLLAAGRGLPGEAERWAADAIARADETDVGWDRLEALRARGTAALLDHDPSRAAASLRRRLGAHAARGSRGAGRLSGGAGSGRGAGRAGRTRRGAPGHDAARELELQEHPWGLATREALQRDRRARRASTGPSRSLRSTRPSERTSCSGSASSRRIATRARPGAAPAPKKWGAARRCAGAGRGCLRRTRLFRLGEETRAELARVGARRPQPSGELTPAERRVAELAGDGLANKEIARTLFCRVKTVEGHLSHVYAKLGVRSRAQLARRLSGAV